MLEKMIKITAEDEHVFDAFQVTPQGNVKGGLVVLQEIFGMTEQLKNVTRFWAEQGYNTLLPAMEIFGMTEQLKYTIQHPESSLLH